MFDKDGVQVKQVNIKPMEYHGLCYVDGVYAYDMDISDCVTVLGNLLDNALYAVQQVEIDRRYLKLKVVFDKGRLMIQCANPYVTQVQYENGKIISTKTDRKEHGFGLKNIEAVAEKYNGCVNVNHKNGVFSVDVLLYLTVDCKK